MPNTNVYFKGNDKNKSKFQDILDQISGIQNEEFDLLQELVDKETPMKLLKSEIDGYRECGNCKSIVVSTNYTLPNYCSNCGYKIDWSNNN